MGFDGAAIYSGAKTGVQAQIKRHAPHALFVHCHCHLLQLACVQAANSTSGIEHVYATFPLEILSLFSKESRIIERDLVCSRSARNEIIKPSDTRWLAHERCA